MLKFDSIENARDLGDYITAEGYKIRSGMLLRTALLADASDEDLRRLKEEFGVCKVIDMRVEVEYSHNPDRNIPGIEPLHIEIMTLNCRFYKGMSELPIIEFLKSPGADMLCDGFYVSFVDDPDCQEQFARVLREIITADGAVLWHCAQGKDRTGLVAAFILFALGADYDTVLLDFITSNITYEPLLSRLKKEITAAGGDANALKNAQTLFGVNTRLFIDALDWIDARYGGMNAYLNNQLKVSDEDIRLLKKKYLIM